MSKKAALDFYLADEQMDFGVMPAGICAQIELPIRLQRGDTSWGAEHIERKHKPWLVKSNLNAQQMVWTKLQQSGPVYSTEENDKSKIIMRMPPAAFVILRLINTKPEPFLTVVSVYFREGGADGTKMGFYPSTKHKELPTFTIKDIPNSPKITIRNKKRF